MRKRNSSGFLTLVFFSRSVNVITFSHLITRVNSMYAVQLHVFISVSALIVVAQQGVPPTVQCPAEIRTGIFFAMRQWGAPLVKYGGRTPKFIWAPCHVMCVAILIGWDPATPPISPHLDSYARALLVSKDRRHLFVTPWGALTTYASLLIYFLWICICGPRCGRNNANKNLFALLVKS